MRQRSADLRNQIEINRLVIRDMPSGVLVIDGLSPREDKVESLFPGKGGESLCNEEGIIVGVSGAVQKKGAVRSHGYGGP